MPKVYFYVIDRDFGFAPNPFHGFCTLATCKPIIRRTAQCGDWIIGMGGTRLGAVGRCIFAMRVDEKLSFDDYWSDARFCVKRPIRNGSRVMMVGDNIYHRPDEDASWTQEDSHHSLPSGLPNSLNIEKDTQTNRVLISRQFIYFGDDAPAVPTSILTTIGYKNSRSHRVFSEQACVAFFHWLNEHYGSEYGLVLGDPFDFDHSSKRYSGRSNKVI